MPDGVRQGHTDVGSREGGSLMTWTPAQRTTVAELFAAAPLAYEQPLPEGLTDDDRLDVAARDLQDALAVWADCIAQAEESHFFVH